MRKNYKLIILVILLVIVDQFIKYIVINNISNGSDIVVISNFLKFTFLTNTGGALGILSGNILMLTLISIMLIWYIVKEINKNENILYVYALTLVLSGALGNLYDRLFRGYVVDYISFTLFKNEMPVFNFADILITFGIIFLIYIVVKDGSNDKKNW